MDEFLIINSMKLHKNIIKKLRPLSAPAFRSIVKNGLTALLAVVISTGCNDFLDQVPDNRTELGDIDAIKEMLTSAYPQYSYFWFTEVMSDNATDVGPAGEETKTNRENYYWQPVSSDAQDSPNGYWTQCYNAIAAANHALRAIEQMGRPNELEPYRGEALICRAYAHFMLVNIFAEHYNPSTASSALGVPFVTEPETTVFGNYSRQTVQEVYDAIEKDLNDGYPLIRNNAFDKLKWHFNKAAVETFMSRFYLYKGDWANVAKYASSALTANPASKLRDWISYNDMERETMNATYGQSTEDANLLLISTVSSAYRSWYHRFAMDLNLGNELRAQSINPTSTPASIAFKLYGSSSIDAYFFMKYKEEFKRESINANYGLPYVMSGVILAEEALFNLAEAYVMTGRYEEMATLLDAYYSKRVLNYSPVSHKVTTARIESIYATHPSVPKPHYAISEEQLPYIKCLLTLRRTEFVHEGMRWFDIKRMHLEVVHKFKDGTASIVLAPDDLRRAVQIPTDAQLFGIKPNERPDEKSGSTVLVPNPYQN